MPRKRLFSRENDLEVEEVLEKFINYSRSKNLSEATIKYYRRSVMCFIDFLQEKNVNQIRDIGPNLIQDYRILLQEKLNSDVSVNTYLRAVRAYLYYAMRMNYLEEFKIQMIKAEVKIKETYTIRELEILLEKPDTKECSFPQYRNWVLINWLISTGNRARTIRNVKIEDLDFKSGYIILRKSKNRKQRIIPMSKVLVNILQEYLQFRDGQENDYLFCTIYGDQLTRAGLARAIQNYNRKRGVDKTSTHLFRHTFAKLWIKNGGDIFRLQKILGHKSMEMVREYVNMFGEDLKDNFERYNPINQFKNVKKDPIQMN